MMDHFGIFFVKTKSIQDNNFKTRDMGFALFTVISEI